jgi:6-phosphofructokinase 1
MPSPSATPSASIATLIAACAIASAASYFIASARMEAKILAEKKRKYERDLNLKKKTIEARKDSKEPSGELIEDLTIDKVFLWEIEDLKSRYIPSNVQNVMKNIPRPKNNPYYFPTLLKKSSSVDVSEKKDAKATPYNKLITNHECILGEIVRKPNQAPFTQAYVRAGPRRELHFDPANGTSG